MLHNIHVYTLLHFFYLGTFHYYLCLGLLQLPYVRLHNRLTQRCWRCFLGLVADITFLSSEPTNLPMQLSSPLTWPSFYIEHCYMYVYMYVNMNHIQVCMSFNPQKMFPITIFFVVARLSKRIWSILILSLVSSVSNFRGVIQCTQGQGNTCQNILKLESYIHVQM